MPRSKKFRRARLIVIVLVVLLVAGVGYGGYRGVTAVRASFPEVDGTVKVAGLSAPVDVKRDANGIPQLYADTSEDLFRAQGYVQAQDRFWEMDVRRHITAGRLSEMFGDSQVDTDSFIRTMGWRQVAQKEYDTKLSPETKKYLQAYADGVNAWLAEHPGGEKASLEYAMLGAVNSGYKPEQWTPVDSVAWLKAMAWNLSGNLQEEIDRSLLAQDFGPDKIAELYPEYPYSRNGTIVKTGTVSGDTYRPADGSTQPGAAPGGSTAQGATTTKALMQGLTDRIDGMPQLLGRPGQGIGSNSWVVAGSHTTTGKPLLANDPHLGPGLPSVWYQMGLHCRTLSPACQFDVSGFTFAGMPGVVIGHNKDIAWGFTNLGADVTDLYLEKVTGPDTYQVDGKDEKFDLRKETIKVAGGEDHTITVRTTRTGAPLISDTSTEQQNVGKYAPNGSSAPDRGTGGYGVALQWTALSPGKTMEAVFELDKAKNWDDFRNAAKDFAVPAQNLIYADAKNIGYQAPGVIPVRGGKGDGSMPAPGWDSSYQWKPDPVPFTALPYSFNPAVGYIVTANQAVVDPNYKYNLTKDWEYGTRAKEITDQIEGLLKNNGKISPDDMQTLQLDNTSIMAKTLVPLLLKQQIDDPYVRRAQDLLKDWNYHQDADSAAAAYYNGVWRNLLSLAFGQKFPADIRAKDNCLLVRQQDDPTKPDSSSKIVTQCGTRDPGKAQPDGGDRWTEVVRAQLDKPDSSWWTYIDSQHKEQKGLDNLLKEAMKNARQDLTSLLGKDISTWSWGRLHKLELREQTLGTDNSSIASGAVHKLLNRGPYRLSGGSAAVDAAGWNAAAGYQVDWIPSMRMVVDLNDLDSSRWINVGGESGHAFHANYNDQTDLWLKGKLLTWAFTPDAVEKATKHKLVLTTG
ncbi:penicillin acylase family protein [Kitasatospora aureofaciens]|uniref:Penicillin amidase n=1 Tax=Kitasatospora aureofaciens TaxID=1894 RepID=A0A1E7NA61_KITAU|nr:penicillin acylase family protein [Kitasatospora aureofaciens]ARF79001.1 penicillin acylase family protein [Kitasatospora aureofaciens]OEV37569.1 penicillin amidase [Kitasatospora aureofaciens]GGU83614.1 penicillin amidase [Kitasatospora aureofaciens]